MGWPLFSSRPVHQTIIDGTYIHHRVYRETRTEGATHPNSLRAMQLVTTWCDT